MITLSVDASLVDSFLIEQSLLRYFEKLTDLGFLDSADFQPSAPTTTPPAFPFLCLIKAIVFLTVPGLTNSLG